MGELDEALGEQRRGPRRNALEQEAPRRECWDSNELVVFVAPMVSCQVHACDERKAIELWRRQGQRDTTAEEVI